MCCETLVASWKRIGKTPHRYFPCSDVTYILRYYNSKKYYHENIIKIKTNKSKRINDDDYIKTIKA